MGSGGFSQVWRARDARGNVAAVKFLTNLNGLARFRRELELARAHSGEIAPAVLGADLGDSFPWIAYELLDGHLEVNARVASHGPMAEDDACEFARDLWAAVGVLHVSGIVHRDLSARNVLLGPSGGIRLIDLGLGKSEQADGTATLGPLGGSPGFAAPEQWSDGVSGTPADYWGWAAVTYFAACGRTVLPAATRQEYQHALTARSEVDMTAVPALLRPALAVGLRYEPAARSAAEISEWLPRPSPPVTDPAYTGDDEPTTPAASASKTTKLVTTLMGTSGTEESVRADRTPSRSDTRTLLITFAIALAAGGALIGYLLASM